MSKKSYGGASDSQEFALDDNLIEIDVNLQSGGDSDSEVAVIQDIMGRQRSSQQILSQQVAFNSQQNENLVPQSQENMFGQLDENNEKQGDSGDEEQIISFRDRDDVLDNQDMQQNNTNNNNKNNYDNNQQYIQRQQQSSNIRVQNEMQVESSFNREEEIGGLNIFQRNQLQSELKKLSTKKDDQAEASQGSQEDKYKSNSQQIYNFTNKSALNYNFEEDYENNIQIYSNQNKQNIFQSSQDPSSLQQPKQFFNMDNQFTIDQQAQNSFLNNPKEEIIKDDDQESSNLLELPVFESEKNEEDQIQQYTQQHQVIQHEQQTKINEEENEDEDDDDDLNLLKNIANNQMKQKLSDDLNQDKQSHSQQNQEIEPDNQQNNNQEQLPQINEVSNDKIEEEKMIEDQQEGEQRKEETLIQNIEQVSQNEQQPNQEQKESLIENNQIIEQQVQLQAVEQIQNQDEEQQLQQNEVVTQDNSNLEKVQEVNNEVNQQEQIQQQENEIQNNNQMINEDDNRAMEVESEGKQQQLETTPQEISNIQEGRQEQSVVEVLQEAQKEIVQKEQKEQNQQKSICEAPQTIANIFQQLAKVFQNMIIPQSVVNMSLHHDQTIQSQPDQFQTQSTVQSQINQLQNQVTYIQNSVVHIPNHLQEITNLLANATSTGIVPISYLQSSKQIIPQSTAINNTTTVSSVAKAASSITQQAQKDTKTPSKKEEIEKPKKGVEKSKKKKEESSEEESDDENNSSEEEESGSEDEDESDDEISDLRNISSKFQNNQKSKIGSGTLSSSKGSSLSLSQSIKKTSYIQPKQNFSAPKTITPVKGLTSSFGSTKQESPQEPQLDSITINAASIGFKEPKLFINESDRVVKSDDLEIEDDNLKPLYEYLNKLDQPTSFLILKELFSTLTDEQIHTTIHDFKSDNKIGVVELFLPKYAKCNSVRIDYYYVEMIIPPPKPKQVEPEIIEEQKENITEKAALKLENVGDRKKYESMSDEQLLGYQKELNLRKQALLDKKQNANPTSDRIKKIQQWNEMKEVCSTVFERIAVLKGKRIQEVCDDFGVKLED